MNWFKYSYKRQNIGNFVKILPAAIFFSQKFGGFVGFPVVGSSLKIGGLVGFWGVKITHQIWWVGVPPGYA